MKFKKVCLVVLSAIMAFGVFCMSGCGKKKDFDVNNGTVASESGDVVMAFIQGANNKPDMEMVQNLASEYCKDKYGFGVKFKPVDIFNQSTIYTNWLVNNTEDIDVLNLCFIDQFQYINEKRIRPLNSLLTEDAAPWLRENMDKYPSSKLIGDDGKLYGIGTIEETGGAGGGSIIFDKAVMNTLGLVGDGEGQYREYDTIDYDDLDYIFDKIKSDPRTNKTSIGGDVYPCPVSQSCNPMGMFAPFDDMTANVTNVMAVLEIKPDGQTTTEVKNYYETESYKQYVEHVSEWYSKGYIVPDADTDKLTYIQHLDAGEWVSMFVSRSAGLGKQYDNDKHEYMQLWIGDTYYTFTGVPQMSMAVTSKSKRPNRAMRFIDAIYSDEYLVNLIQFGVKDRHWEFVEGEDHYITTTAWNVENKGYADLPGVYGNKTMLYGVVPVGGDSKAKCEVMKAAKAVDVEIEKQAKLNSSPAVGFRYDSKSQNNRIKGIVAGAMAQYANNISCGKGKKGNDGTYTGAGSTYAEFISALKGQNIGKVIEDKQKQLDAWLASK